MILLDGNNIAQKTFFSVLGELDKNGDIDKKNFVEEYEFHKKDLLNIYLYEVFNYITGLSNYKSTYGDILIAFDTSNSWRRRFYPDYKGKRREKEKEKDRNEKFISKLLYKYMQLVEKLLVDSGFFVLKVRYNETYGIEGDDVIATLVMNLCGDNDKHLISSVDIDFYQLLNKNVKQYHPIERKILDVPSKRAVNQQLLEWFLKGQSKDSIPSIKAKTELSEDFIKWVKENHDLEVTTAQIDKIETTHQYLNEEYKAVMFDLDEEEIEAGKRKRQRNLDMYKATMFSAKNYKEFEDNLEEMLDTNPRYRHNFKRNQILVDFYKIPKPVQKKILDAYESLEKPEFVNKIKIRKMFMKIGASRVAELVDKF